MRVLYIHGRAQGKKSEDELLGEWSGALEAGLALAGAKLDSRVTFDMPFYGAKLDEFVEKSKLPSPSDLVQMGGGTDPGFAQFAQTALLEMSKAGGIEDAEIHEEMPDGPQEMGPQSWEWVQAIVKVIDRKWPKISGGTIERFLKDVYLYLDKPAVGNAINSIVEEKLTKDRTLVVGHSLGSVVGYNVLRSNQINLAGFITIGSPLGIKAVSGQLGVPMNPAGNFWLNAYDKRDIVALNPLDADHFRVAPQIEDFDKVRNETSNHHGISGYLGDRLVAQRIYDWTIAQAD